MAKITAPNQEYTGTVGGVGIANGVGYTSDPHMVEWFARKGYGVEPEDSDSEEIKALAKNLPTKLGDVDTITPEEQAFVHRVGRPIEDAEASKGMDADTRAALHGPGVGKLIDVPGGAPQIMRGHGSGGSKAEQLDADAAAKQVAETHGGVEVTATGDAGRREAEENAGSDEGGNGGTKGRARKQKGS